MVKALFSFLCNAVVYECGPLIMNLIEASTCKTTPFQKHTVQSRVLARMLADLDLADQMGGNEFKSRTPSENALLVALSHEHSTSSVTLADYSYSSMKLGKNWSLRYLGFHIKACLTAVHRLH